jgi:hypothetical protein
MHREISSRQGSKKKGVIWVCVCGTALMQVWWQAAAAVPDCGVNSGVVTVWGPPRVSAGLRTLPPEECMCVCLLHCSGSSVCLPPVSSHCVNVYLC